jgi:hydroxyacyl-ACP dehydratase HTD2-like protein with hotdog domain
MALDINDLEVGTELPAREHTASNVSLFLYNAAVWNPHRIHYDERYTTEVEAHPGIVIDGPLQGDWLCQVALNWLGTNGTLTSFNYTNRRAAYLGETLTSGGKIVALDPSTGQLDLELHIKNEAGDIITPGSARVMISA